GVVAGLAGAPETDGLSLGVTVLGAVEASGGLYVSVGAVKNMGAVANAMAAKNKPYKPNEKNLQEMEKGNAPLDKDGNRVELHHDGQKQNSPLKEMTRQKHRGKGNFTKNHQNTGQKASKIDRSKFQQQKEKHWKQEAAKHRKED